MSIQSESQLSAQLRALRIDPPDQGFSERLSARLAEATPAVESGGSGKVVSLRKFRGNRKTLMLLAAATVFVAGGAAALGGPTGVSRWFASWTAPKAPSPTLQSAVKPPSKPPAQVRRVPVPQRVATPPPAALVEIPRVPAPVLKRSPGGSRSRAPRRSVDRAEAAVSGVTPPLTIPTVRIGAHRSRPTESRSAAVETAVRRAPVGMRPERLERPSRPGPRAEARGARQGGKQRVSQAVRERRSRARVERRQRQRQRARRQQRRTERQRARQAQ